MKLHVTLSLLLCIATLSLTVTASNLTTYDDFLKNGRLVTDGVNDVRCTAIGTTCSSNPNDCNNIYFCSPGANNQWNVIEASCQDGQSCLNNVCTSDLNLSCRYKGLPFKCTSFTGIYPDVQSCHRYHVCIEPVEPSGKAPAYTGTCSGNSVFDPNTRYCIKPASECQSVINNNFLNCTSVGQTKALKDNVYLYAVCLPYNSTNRTLYPFVQSCPNGQTWNGTTSQCS